MKVLEKKLNEVCNWLMKNTSKKSKIWVSQPNGGGMIVGVHNKIKRAMKIYVDVILAEQETRITKLEKELKVPCCIDDGKFCNEPFCRYMFFERKANETFAEYKDHIRSVLEQLKIKKVRKS